ncbi:hypothetical protein BG653_01407 [Streptomyces platensis]|uniref:Uncharacterized protein n=1 Tax=Streptomyces platensis TaxID=58346 RepID=A0ABX3Y2Y9_STRPT|nr:hypothetical protein BG653_01407 [Streptomyces platensis]
MRGGRRRGFLADEGPAQGVIRLVRVEEGAVHLRQFELPIGGERAVGLVAFPVGLLRGDTGLCRGRRGQPGGEPRGLRGEVLRGAVEDPVHQAEPGSGRGGDRQGACGELPGHLGARPARQGVGPVFGSVEPHQPVVGVEHHGRAAPHLVGGEGQHRPAGRGIAAERGDHQPVGGGQDGVHQIVHGVDIGPGLLGGVGGGLDDMQMNAVGEEVPAAAEDQHGGRPGAGVAVGGEQPPAVVGAHRTAGEGELQEAGRAVLAIADIAPGPEAVAGVFKGGRDFGERREAVAQRQGGGQFQGAGLPCRTGRPQFRNPYRAIGRRPADRAISGGEQLTRRAGQGVLRVATVQMPGVAEKFVPHAGLGVGGAQLADDGVGGVRVPVDPAQVLTERGPGAAGFRGVGQLALWLRAVGSGRHTGDGRQDRSDRGIGDLVAVEVALAHAGDGAARRGPDVAAVHLVVGLKHRDAPPVRAQMYRPVQGGGPLVADGPGVHDQTDVGGPHLPGDGRLEHRRHDQLRRMAAYDLGERCVPCHQLHAHLVSVVTEFGVHALRQTVERAGDEQNAHSRLPWSWDRWADGWIVPHRWPPGSGAALRVTRSTAAVRRNAARPHHRGAGTGHAVS